MSRTILTGLAALGLAVVGLAAGLVVVLATDDDEADTPPAAMHQMGLDDDFVGMMGAMTAMDSDAMLEHMREVLGEEAYEQMLTHMEEHQAGGPMTGESEIDRMMHQLMDGMMQQMPADAEGRMPSGLDEHDATMPPADGTAMPGETPTPGQ